jgi:uncharacterized protein with FMN-binding domain
MTKLKKIALSAFIVVGFSAYALFQNQSNATSFQVANGTSIGGQLPVQNTTPTPAAPATPATETPTTAPATTNQQSSSQTAAAQSSSQNTPAASAPPPATTGQYKNGTYTGPVADAYYGYVQVQATIQGGKLTNVVFLQHPSDRSTSVWINQQAMPYLIQEALAAQSANVNTISGASETSQAFRASLGAALQSAKA